MDMFGPAVHVPGAGVPDPVPVPVPLPLPVPVPVPVPLPVRVPVPTVLPGPPSVLPPLPVPETMTVLELVDAVEPGDVPPVLVTVEAAPWFEPPLDEPPPLQPLTARTARRKALPRLGRDRMEWFPSAGAFSNE
jgi:hypothetical protein